MFSTPSNVNGKGNRKTVTEVKVLQQILLLSTIYTWYSKISLKDLILIDGGLHSVFPLCNCVALMISLNFSESHFPHL